jgi:predicted kinase
VTARFRRFLDHREVLFEGRATAGEIVDGHGDLQAADVFCLDDGPRILDCIEFSDELRFGDVLADIGFLAMDLERLGAPDLAERLVERWASAAERDDEPVDVPETLLHHYVAYRAHVRAKVACLRWAQERPDDPAREAAADEARRLLALCDRHLDAARVRFVLVGGAPGTGKSTVAAGVGAATGWPVLRSDVVRKRLAGLDPLDRSGAAAVGEGLYGPELTEVTYRTLLDAAQGFAAAGHSVILDASWTSGQRRAQARAAAEGAGAEVVELCCELPAEVAAERIRARARSAADASDADEVVAAALRSAADPWPEATPLDTSRPPAEVIAHLVERSGHLFDRPPVG